MNISIVNSSGDHLDYKSFTFPGGEIGLKLNSHNLRFFDFRDQEPVTIVARLQDAKDILSLAMVKDALGREKLKGRKIDLFMPYLPYARQDRVCDLGEALSLKVFCDYINFLNFSSVTIVDPHSDVGPVLLNNVHVISQFNIFDKWTALNNRVLEGLVFVAPDAGSNKKTSKLASYFNHTEFVRADKLRDLATGKIKETIVYCDDLKGKDVMIADDIVDGGRTFIELAKVLKQKNAGRICLYVTHGIFSQGMEVLFENGINEIWTTNSFKAIENHPFLNVLLLNPQFNK